MVFCGIDIGTTSTKAVALDRDGQVMGELTLPAPADADAATDVYWYEHFCQALDLFAAEGRLGGEDIACSVTGQGGSFVLLDERLHAVGRPCSWTRKADDAIVQDLIDMFGETGYYHITGWPPHAWLAACKLRQMADREQLPDTTRYIATVPDFIRTQLTGSIATDITSAQITGLADFRSARWSRDILKWAGIRVELLPDIAADPDIVVRNVTTRWGNMTLTTGSHDQYAAMEAAGLACDRSVMLGTGTAWVINGRTRNPTFDDKRFLIHPGRDLYPDCYGFIITLWEIGAGFDRLLERLGVTTELLRQRERDFAWDDEPQGPVSVDLAGGAIRPEGGPLISARRYMEWAASVVAHALDRCDVAGGLEKITITGGAMASWFWPQVIADVCDLTVEAVEYPQLTAYGATLHARKAVQAGPHPQCWPRTATVRTCVPRRSHGYRAWYHEVQKPVLDTHEL